MGELKNHHIFNDFLSFESIHSFGSQFTLKCRYLPSLTRSNCEFSENPEEVLGTAKKLAQKLQQNSNMALAPDSATAAILNKWLDTHIPVNMIHHYPVDDEKKIYILLLLYIMIRFRNMEFNMKWIFVQHLI